VDVVVSAPHPSILGSFPADLVTQSMKSIQRYFVCPAYGKQRNHSGSKPEQLQRKRAQESPERRKGSFHATLHHFASLLTPQIQLGI
jgi:hypothetical protein